MVRMSSEPPVRGISDTAAWVAMYRAAESERPDAAFRDPYARRLAGERGERIMATMAFAKKHAWSYTARTHLFDTFIAREVRAGSDMVLNLAAGLDTRPYRIELPASLQWVEVDLPDLISYKEDVLRSERPACRLERIALDLSDVSGRRALFTELANRAERVTVLTEGLLVYLSSDEVSELARDLATPLSFRRWATDLVLPALLKMLQKQVGTPLSQAGAPLKFAPAEGPAFFARFGWQPIEVTSMLHAAAKLKRLPFWMRPLALFPDSKGTKPGQIWGGGVLLEKEHPR
ncbi:MAG TPA: SAM-dependent methyltransferase [Burkholderiaceae bacterium]|nr:SAM-dependent methyltransferase [Burkholderiaceae bacterium]